tara:strand:+ start:318 stop:686 length:369 start_codon:yes stop_codon:yes gene_type:complete
LTEEKIIVVPQDEFLDVIVQMDEYAKVSYHALRDFILSDDLMDYSDGEGTLVDLCEFYAGCLRTKEVILDAMQKEVDSKGAKVPENSIVIEDEDYLLITTLLTGLLNIERTLLGQNVSLKQH